MALPLPQTLRPHVALGSSVNRSLAFDRGFAGYDERWSAPIPPDAKKAFLVTFRDGFARPRDFDPFITRRTRALEAAGASSICRYSQTRLVIGLGLPHPTETALLLDRLTGCPYIPGSSLKGVLREAARQAAAGELDTGDPGDPAFWREHLDRLFGPELGGDAIPAKGELLLHEAFPERWPALEVDILTPHYQPYYGDDPEKPSVPPADWHDPVPVAFLTIRAGTKFRFWLGHTKPGRAEDDLARAKRLLESALDWIGAGAKTSSGYGVFGDKPPAESVAVEPTREDVQAPETERPLRDGEARWLAADLFVDRGRPTIKGPEGQLARGFKDDLPEALFDRLSRGMVVKADTVVKRGGDRWVLVAVERTHS
jgi:CRISPR-associated protein Cmr6